MLWKYLLRFHRRATALGMPKPPAAVNQTVIATVPRQSAHFYVATLRISQHVAERIRSTHKGTGALMAWTRSRCPD